MPRHDALERFAFNGREVAQVYARDRRLPEDAPLLYLERGQADRYRDACRDGHLVCPIPGCEEPGYVAVGGSRRHHFRHRAFAGGHGQESWYHQCGKQLVLAWLREHHPEAESSLEEATEDKQRPDVLAVFPDGRRFGFEVQYAPITPEEWLARHERYAAKGIRDVWLFGHTLPHLQRERAEWLHGLLKLSPTLHAVATANHRVRFINPDEQSIASQVIETAERPFPGSLEVAVDALDDCWIEGDRFLSPTDVRELAAHRARVDAERRAAEEAERQARLEAGRAKRKAAWLEQQRAQELADWAAFRPGFLERCQLLAVPLIVETEIPGDRGIFKVPAHWHAILFEQLIDGRIGEAFSFARAAAPFAAMQPDHKKRVWKALGIYLFHLRRRGYVWLENDWNFIHQAVVLADLHTPPHEAVTAITATRPSDLHVLSHNGDVVVADEDGTVVQHVRKLRPFDQLPSREAYLERLHRPPIPGSACVPVHAPIREVPSRENAFVVEVTGDVYELLGFKQQLLELANRHPGDRPLDLVVRYSDAAWRNDRQIELPRFVDGSDVFEGELNTLLEISERAAGPGRTPAGAGH